MDRLRAIKYFVEVSDKRSFTRAARSLGVPAASVSRRIQELEADLGVELIHRTTRVVNLTELGNLYLEQIRPSLAGLDYADELVNQDPDHIAGRLRITAIPDYGRHCLMPALANFRRLYPKIVLDIELTDQISNLANNDVDLAIRSTSALPDRAVARRLSTNQFIMVASIKYLERCGHPASLAELERHQAIIFRRPEGLLYWQADTADGWKELANPQAYISNQGEELVNEALAGTGIALLPEWGVSEHLESGSLTRVAIEDVSVSISRNPNSGIYLLYHRPKYGLKKVQIAAEFLISELSDDRSNDLRSE